MSCLISGIPEYYIASMGHTRGFESGWNTRREEATIETVWGADSFRRENGGAGQNMGSGQGWSNNNNNISGGGIRQERGTGTGQGWSNNNNVAGSDGSRFTQETNRQFEEVWGNIGTSSGTNQH